MSIRPGVVCLMSVPGPVPLVVHHDLLQWKDATEAPAVDGGGEGPEVPTG